MRGDFPFMSNSETYRATIQALRKAGFTLILNNRHERWESADGNRGVSISHNLRDKNRARALLRNVGVDLG